MRHAKTKKVITLAQSMLDFANLSKVDSTEKIYKIFRRHAPYDLWGQVDGSDYVGIASLIDLRDDTRDRLEKIMSGGRRKILGEIVSEAPAASAPAYVRGVEIAPLPYVPKIQVIKGRVGFKVQWLVTGAHAGVIFGLLELFVDGSVDRLARCKNCRAFYLKTPALRVACSPACRWQNRKKGIAENVREYRRKQRRNRA